MEMKWHLKHLKHASKHSRDIHMVAQNSTRGRSPSHYGPVFVYFIYSFTCACIYIFGLGTGRRGYTCVDQKTYLVAVTLAFNSVL